MTKKHINDVQAPTVDEHFKLLLEDETILDSNLTNVTPDDLPDWYDEKLFEEGQNYCKQNILLMEIGYIMGLLAISTVPSVRKIVQCTNENSIPCAAFKRQLQTQLYIFNIFLFNQKTPDSKLYESLNVIRWRHNISSKIVRKTGIEGFLQRDMAYTQCAILIYVSILANRFGVSNKLEEGQEGFYHFWRVIGYMIGVSDRLNICRQNMKESYELCQKIVNDVFRNSLIEASSDFYNTVLPLLDGLSYIDPSLNKDAMLALLYRMHDIEYKGPLGWYSWLNMKYRDFILKLYFLPYIGTITRIYYNFILRFMYLSAQIWPVFAWLSFGRKNCQTYLYYKKDK